VSSSDLTIELPARAENVAVVRHAVAGLAEAVGMAPGQIADLKTVVTEACMNAVVHAYDEEPGPIETHVHRDGDALVVTVRDRGAGIRPRPDTSRQSLRMGLPLIAALSTSFELSGALGQGTVVMMRMNLSSNGDEPAEPATAPLEHGARLSMPARGLVGPVLSRVVSIFAVRANFSVDRLSDAILLGDAISAQGADLFADDTTHVVVDEVDGSLKLRVGPLREGGGETLLERMRIPEIGGSLEGLADAVEVERDGDGERLLLKVSGRA